VGTPNAKDVCDRRHCSSRSIVLLLSIGQQGLQALWFLGFAPLFGLGYGFVGKKIARIRDAIPPDEGVVIPGLIVRGVIESAGIVVLGEESLILHPLVGKPSATKLSEILSVREVSFFNGRILVHDSRSFETRMCNSQFVRRAVPSVAFRGNERWFL